jgi:sporulation protein YtfJ
MTDHAIEGLMKTTMDSLREMIDVNTIIGDPVETKDGTVIIPISRVSVGFASGGSEIPRMQSKDEEKGKLPFGGGSGAGISLNPVAFLIIGKDQIKLLPIVHTNPIDKLIDGFPELVQELKNLMSKGKCKEEHMQETVANPT